jgi:hypothetical protein
MQSPLKINFEIIDKDTSKAKEVVIEIKAFTDFGNRNGYYFTIEDLLIGADKIPVKETHKGKVFADTYLFDREIKTDKNGKYLHGFIKSTNKEFIKKIQDLTGFSIELGIFRESDLFQNETGEFVIKQGGIDFQSIAALYGELPGSAGTEILNKKLIFNIGSGKVPKNNFKNSNNINMEITKEELQNVIKEQITFALKEQADEEAKANTITFSLKKEELTAESIIKFAKDNGFDLVEKSEVEADEIEANIKDAEEKTNLAFAKKSKPVMAGEGKSEEEPKAKVFTFSNPNNIN